LSKTLEIITVITEIKLRFIEIMLAILSDKLNLKGVQFEIVEIQSAIVDFKLNLPSVKLDFADIQLEIGKVVLVITDFV